MFQKKNFKSYLKIFFVIALVLSWQLSGFPPIWLRPRIPQEIKEIRAAATVPAFQAAGSEVTGTGNITVAWPAHQAGDVGLLFIESTGGQAANLGTAAGFAAVTNSPQSTGSGTGGTRITVYWCRATSSSMASPVITDPGNHAYGVIITFRGVIDNGDPWDITAGGNKAVASTTTTMSAVTTTVANTLIVLAASRDNDLAAAAWTNASWSNGNLASLTERFDAGTADGNGGGLGIVTGQKASIGDTGATTATVTSTVDGHITIALKPPNIVLGNDSSEPTNITIGPGGSITDLNNFKLNTGGGTDTVTAATVTLAPANAFNNIAQVDITDTGNTVKCSAATGLTSNTVSLSGCNISVTTTATTYKVRITPKSHVAMPGAPGASYETTGTITAFTSTNTQTGTDTGSATVTVDNGSPSDATWGTITSGDQQIALNWSNPLDSDFSKVLILMKTGSSISDAPTEGTEYSAGNTIGSSTVIYVDTGTSYTKTGLSNGTTYYFKIFSYDTRINYAAGASTGPHTPFVISISLTTDGSVNFGYIALNGTKNTTSGANGINDPETVRVDSGPADLDVKTTVFTQGANTWTLGTSSGNNIVKWEYSKDGTNWTIFEAADPITYIFDTNVADDATRTIYFRITTPIETSSYLSYSSNVTIIASAP